MSSKQGPTAQLSVGYREPTQPMTSNCLLCLVLWPAIVSHRHLPPDDSSEAKTLFLTQMRPANDAAAAS
ncbi:MAG TPA: hypothetical protein VNO50_09670 [Pyrinomonadaceae bacterium]|nr:hypothetical protein [Pyrinomonadaceae bacterium]